MYIHPTQAPVNKDLLFSREIALYQLKNSQTLGFAIFPKYLQSKIYYFWVLISFVMVHPWGGFRCSRHKVLI